ncbi:MAG: YqhA family protein [Spirochaetes bacterium]|nr:YqhA family protein [Spirochaetota bacterium]
MKKSKYLKNDKRRTFNIEKIFEHFLWSGRFLVLFAVVSSLIASFILFVLASKDILFTLKDIVYYLGGNHSIDIHTLVIVNIIGAIDVYLIAVVLILFSFGLYELFISHIDAAKKSEASSILNIGSLDVLKDKIAQVIIMALIVKYFQMILNRAQNFSTALDMIYLALSIFALSTGLYFLHKSKSGHN